MKSLARPLAALTATSALLATTLGSVAVTGSAAATELSGAATAAAAPRAIPRSDFLTPAQIRARLDFTRPLSQYYLTPTDQRPQPDIDCATRGRPEVTSVAPLPALRARSQVFGYRVPGATWQLVGQVEVYEYKTTAKAKAALTRIKKSVRSTTRYAIVCEAINPTVTGQAPTGALRVKGTSFSWRHQVRATHAGSWRHVVSTQGKRLVWVTLGREKLADLDWSHGTPKATFPRYPSVPYLRSLAAGATAKAL